MMSYILDDDTISLPSFGAEKLDDNLPTDDITLFPSTLIIFSHLINILFL